MRVTPIMAKHYSSRVVPDLKIAHFMTLDLASLYHSKILNNKPYLWDYSTLKCLKDVGQFYLLYACMATTR